MLLITRKLIRNSSLKNSNDSIHYQGFSNNDRNKRNKISINYIQSYLIGYINWLKVVKSIN